MRRTSTRTAINLIMLVCVVSRLVRPSRAFGGRQTFRLAHQHVKKSKIPPLLLSTATDSASIDASLIDSKLITLSSVSQADLTTLLQSWGYPKFRANQVWQWIRVQGVTDVELMHNIPKKLREQLSQFTKPSSLTTVLELVSKKDGTIKRAYRCNSGSSNKNVIIESVLMPYNDGRVTACISSQAGCAQGCVFCATGQMGLLRQLTADEIYEQVARFSAELKQDGTEQRRLSNIVFMGMGEPLANYRNVKTAIQRIQSELGIGARKITISTVGIVPNIRKLTRDPDMPPVRLAVSLHCATDAERTALLPANAKFGGLDELMLALKEYMDVTGRRITLEWALIAGQNDTPEVARQLGDLIVKRFNLRRDMVHVNVIPLNPTKGFTSGAPSQRSRVDAFMQVLNKEYNIACTPRVRRGIDIDAGCGQLTSQLLSQQEDRTVLENILSSPKKSTSKASAPTLRTKVPVEGDNVVKTQDIIIDNEDNDDDFGNEDYDNNDDDVDDDDDNDENNSIYSAVEKIDNHERDRLLKMFEGTTIVVNNNVSDEKRA